MWLCAVLRNNMLHFQITSHPFGVASSTCAICTYICSSNVNNFIRLKTLFVLVSQCCCDCCFCCLYCFCSCCCRPAISILCLKVVCAVSLLFVYNRKVQYVAYVLYIKCCKAIYSAQKIVRALDNIVVIVLEGWCCSSNALRRPHIRQEKRKQVHMVTVTEAVHRLEWYILKRKYQRFNRLCNVVSCCRLQSTPACFV